MQPFPAYIQYLPTQDITYHGTVLGKEWGTGLQFKYWLKDNVHQDFQSFLQFLQTNS